MFSASGKEFGESIKQFFAETFAFEMDFRKVVQKPKKLSIDSLRSSEHIVENPKNIVLKLDLFYKFKQVKDRPKRVNDRRLVSEIVSILADLLQNVQNLSHIKIGFNGELILVCIFVLSYKSFNQFIDQIIDVACGQTLQHFGYNLFEYSEHSDCFSVLQFFQKIVPDLLPEAQFYAVFK